MIDKTPRSATWTFIEELLRLEAAGGILLVLLRLWQLSGRTPLGARRIATCSTCPWACLFGLRCDLKAVRLALDWISEEPPLIARVAYAGDSEIGARQMPFI
jgi:hypothetical protein